MSHYSEVAVGMRVSKATFLEWTDIIAILCWLDSQYNYSLVLDIHYSDVAVGWTVSTANVVGRTVIIAKLLLPGQSIHQLLWAGQSL